MTTIVLLAPFGQVGFELKRSLSVLGQVLCLSRIDVDFSDVGNTIARVAALKPTIIVNASAWTAVDKAETEVEAAYRLNADLPQALAQLAEKLDCWLVHYSTDYVYPGGGKQAWLEEDIPSPLSVYGASKLAGDRAIQAGCTNYLIFRTSWVYAARGNNFMKTMLKLAKQRTNLSVVADQFGAPTPARLIANVTALALRQVLFRSENQSGIYHLATAGYTNWYEFAEAIFGLARNAGLELTLDSELFTAISTAEYPTPAKRPENSRLNLSKLELTFGLKMPHWRDQLDLTFDEFCSNQLH